MSCPVCGCELPAIASFCNKCGSKVGPGGISSPPTSSPAMGTLFCGECGHPYDSSHRFCNSCGRAISTVSVTLTASDNSALGPAASEIGSAASETVLGLHQTASAPPTVDVHPQNSDILQTQPYAPPDYATFVALSIGSTLAASVTAFTLANGAARGQWTSAPLSVVSTVVCLLLLSLAIRKVRGLRGVGAVDGEVLLRRTKLVRRNVLFAFLFIGTAVLVGNGIGTSGAETDGLIAESDQMSRLSGRISKSRGAAKLTVLAQVEMYKSIEPDVEQLGSVLTKLREEWAIYERKYPSQHEAVAKTLRGIETGVKQVALLHQQIAAAKEIGNVGNPDGQFRMWQTAMQPLLDRENELFSAR
jgi:Double zinc ribbon